MHKRQLGLEERVFMSRIAACVCQLSVTIAKYKRQEKIIMKTRVFFPSHFGRFKNMVAPF